MCLFKSFTFIYEIYLFPSQKFTFTLHSLVSRPNISSWQLRTELNFTSFVSFQKFQIYLFLSRGRSFCFVNFNISVSAIRRDLLCYSAFLSPSLPFQNCTNPTKSIMSQPNKVLSQNFWRQVGQIWENHTHILYLEQERWCSGIEHHWRYSVMRSILVWIVMKAATLDYLDDPARRNGKIVGQKVNLLGSLP